MSKKASSTVVPPRSRAYNGKYNSSTEWHGFVNIALTDADKARAAAWYTDVSNVDRAVDAALRQGYRITLKMEGSQTTYSAFMTPADSGHENAGWGLSERAGDWWRALCRLMFIHAICLETDWSANKGDVADVGDW